MYRTPVTPPGCWPARRLCLLMTPGLAFFYGGMVRAKSVLNMMMMSFSAHGRCRHSVGALRLLAWPSATTCRHLFGDPSTYLGPARSHRRQRPCSPDATGAGAVSIPVAGTIPQTVFVAFQPMFAIITVALISGAVADRLQFGAWLVFAGLWATLVYFPGRALGVRLRRRQAGDSSPRRLDRQQTARDRLRRWHGGAHQRRCRQA